MNVTSPAAQVIISIIPIVGIFIAGVVAFFSLLWHHHEVKQQIKAGIYKKEQFNYKAYALLIGLLLTGIGLVLSIYFYFFDGPSPALLGGLIPFICGVCVLLFYALNPDFKKKNVG